ncbi:MAG TPA: alpha/beta fold hydrolase [Bryobacteraceae bacterium]|nr:alpha/beta fold hydrolase [Bryobacteraceae bacterium]
MRDRHTFHEHTEDQIAAGIGPGRLDIAYQRLGEPDAPALLLIIGLACQSIHWPDSFCNLLLAAGMQVIRFDNRDAGLSTHLHEAPAPNLPAVLEGDCSSVSYTLSDMADDTAALLDFLDIPSAHVVGASMGGQIAQTLAIRHPERVRSLTSLMATTGDRTVGQADAAVMGELFTGPPPATRDAVIAQMVRAARIVGSPAFPAIEGDVAARAGRAYDRSYDLAGIGRQAVATVASGDRTEQLRQLRMPTLVIHGLADRMCAASGGQATAEAIPGAELWLVEGMGHDLPTALQPAVAARIAALVRRAEEECRADRT